MGHGDILAQPLPGGLTMLKGDGSNIVVAAGPSGTLLVDDEYPNLAEKVQGALAAQNAPPVRIVINTHFHCDHTGGNETFARAGATIIAQERTAQRLHVEQVMSLYGRQAALAPVAWPKIAVRTRRRLQWNGQEVDLIALPAAHTDGDLAIFFRGANVLATGDIYVVHEYLPPYFDDLNGGSLDGMIAATQKLLELADDRTTIVPGHGDISSRADLRDYYDHLVGIRAMIKDAIARSVTEDDLVAQHPIEFFAGKGRGVDRWVRVVYREYHH
jgi:cyclase